MKNFTFNKKRFLAGLVAFTLVSSNGFEKVSATEIVSNESLETTVSSVFNTREIGYKKRNIEVFEITGNEKKLNFNDERNILIYSKSIKSFSDVLSVIEYFCWEYNNYDTETIYLDLDKYLDSNPLFIKFIIDKCLSKGIHISTMGSSQAYEFFYEYVNINDKCLKYNSKSDLSVSLAYYPCIYDNKNKRYLTSTAYDTYISKIDIDSYKEIYSNKLNDEIYVMKSGDTLYDIANKYSMELSDLLRYNNITIEDTYSLSVGTKIIIPSIYSINSSEMNDTNEKDNIENDIEENNTENEHNDNENNKVSENEYFVSNTSKLNVRNVAGTDSKKIDSIPVGTKVLVKNIDSPISKNNYEWVNIRYYKNGEIQEGWVAKNYITKGEVNLPDGDIDATTAVVIDTSNNTILYDKSANERMCPASITKILTAYIVEKYGNLDDTLVFSSNAINVEGHIREGYATSLTNIVNVGNEISVRDALNISLLLSDNPTTIALQEYVESITGIDFIELMNIEAKEIGCKDSNFTNSYGYEDKNHYVTAYDMGLIASAITNNSKYVMNVLGTQSYKLEYNGSSIFHQSKLFDSSFDVYSENIIGCKSGYTDISGQTMVSIFNKEDKTIVTVTLHSNSRESRDYDALNLASYGFYKLGIYDEIEKERIYEKVDSEKYYKGLDISEYQGELDLSDYYTIDERADFIIIRLGSSDKKATKKNGNTKRLDDYFKNNILLANKTTLAKGIYFYSTATTDEEANEEISFLNEWFNYLERNEIKLELPVYIDIEDKNYSALLNDKTCDKQVLIIDKICTAIKERGYRPGIYISYKGVPVIHKNFNDKYDVWTAGGWLYDENTEFDDMLCAYVGNKEDDVKQYELTDTVNMYQTTQHGYYEDVFRNVDFDYASKDRLDEIIDENQKKIR